MIDRQGWAAMIDQLNEDQYWAVGAVVCALAAGTIHVDEVERLLVGLADRRGRIPAEAFDGRRLRLVDNPDD